MAQVFFHCSSAGLLAHSHCISVDTIGETPAVAARFVQSLLATPGAEDWRNWYFRDDRKREVYERTQAIASDLGVGRDRLPDIALRYVLSHPAVSTAIPGMRRVRNVEINVASGDGQGLPPADVETLKRHRWIRNFYA